MLRNSNPWVSELTTWHGHDRGGVRVPFQSAMGNPLGSIIYTPLIERLHRLAADLVNGTPETPRWIFLIGGPGNGKSEAVEAFVRELDELAGASQELVGLVTQKFKPDPVTPRRVEVLGSELKESAFQENLRRLIIIQDASAVDVPDENAEDTLIEDLADIITSPAGQEPVFICCANRGLVARARSAIQERQSFEWLSGLPIPDILTQLLTATGLGPGALAVDRPKCWPLECDSRFAAWPLDLDSIVLGETGPSPLAQMFSRATDEQNWNGAGSCGDCSSKSLCPFYINAQMLRDEKTLRNLLVLLRHGEMATGQRWNFRDAFSLCGELVVGQRGDFDDVSDAESPCSWVHDRVDEISYGSQAPLKLTAAWDLTLHLYSQSLFPSWPDLGEQLHLATVQRSALTHAVVRVFSQRKRSEGTQVRQLLAGALSEKLDPWHATPPSEESLLRKVEDAFGQSVLQGLETFKGQTTPLIEHVLQLMSSAEADWGDSVRDSSRVNSILEALRILSSTMVKRFLGVREGEYLNREQLVEYEAVLVDSSRLVEIVQPLRSVLAPGGIFGGSLVRVFGQPLPVSSKDVLVTNPLGNVIPRVASSSTPGRPGHDIPWVEVERQRIPITFDLFAALQAQAAGAEFASFAPHTRAAIDKVKNAIAARLSRDKDGMLGGGVEVAVGTLGNLVPSADGALELQPRGEKS